jgi:hypothetical protein
VRSISATGLVAAPPEDVFDFLSSLENHWRLVDRFVVVVSVDGTAAVVRLGGPFGLRRTARTRVTSAVRPRAIVGVAELRGGTRARVTWTLEPAGAAPAGAGAGSPRAGSAGAGSAGAGAGSAGAGAGSAAAGLAPAPPGTGGPPAPPAPSGATPPGTHVRLAAEVERAGWLDRLVLTLGGREWMRRRFTGGLARLAARYGA